MNCVYDAWTQHAEWLGVKPSGLSYPLFRIIYRLGQNEGGIYGGCVPLMIWALNAVSGLRIAHVQHHKFFDVAAWIAGSETVGQRSMSSISDFGDEGIDIKPAIYLLLSSRHAVFSQEIPKQFVTLAIQLERREQYVRAARSASAVSLQRTGVRRPIG